VQNCSHGSLPTRPLSSVSTASLSPLTTLRMPGGSPASIMSWPSRIGTEGSRSDGLRMKALPQAMAGANFHIGIIAGSHGGLGVSKHPACTDLHPGGWHPAITGRSAGDREARGVPIPRQEIRYLICGLRIPRDKDHSFFPDCHGRPLTRCTTEPIWRQINAKYGRNPWEC
jgi:hypothetical protein